jgi:hypothetical protein
MNLDWGRLRAVVIQSDDWGLCAWVPDEEAYRALTDGPAWRTPAGRTYGRSTLESASDVARLRELLLEFRGGDGFPVVLQANTVMAAPDYERLEPPLFQVEEFPVVRLPDTPSRWTRPGLWDEVRRSQDAGVWWPELHGLHHLPVAAWLAALRRGTADARRAHEHQSPVCQAVEGSGEYDPSEPLERRTHDLEQAAAAFESLFGRRAWSLCPPDYRWDDALERDAERLGIPVLQGKAEQSGRHARARRWLHQLRWPEDGARFYMPARIAFEPRGSAAPGGRVGAAAAHAAARAAWSRGQPAVVSTHRVSYAHLDGAWSEAGRAALRDLLGRLMGDNALFLTDAEVWSLQHHGWSSRAIGVQGALVRCYGSPSDAASLAVPPGTDHVAVREGRAEGARFRIENGHAVAWLTPGEYLVEWKM